MNRKKIILGVVLILIPFVLSLSSLTLLVISTFSLSMIAGVVIFLDGIGAFRTRKERVGKLDKTILEMISRGEKIEGIASSTGVSAAVIQERVSFLQSAGFLLGDKLTEKGFDALQE